MSHPLSYRGSKTLINIESSSSTSSPSMQMQGTSSIGSAGGSGGGSSLPLPFHLSRRALVRGAIVAALLVPSIYFLNPFGSDGAAGASGAGLGAVGGAGGKAVSGGVGRNEAPRGQGLAGGGVGQWIREKVGGQSVEEEAWVDLSYDMPWTSYDGGLPGYTVFSNLYLSQGALLAVRPGHNDHSAHLVKKSLDVPKPREIMSGDRVNGDWPAAGEDRWREVVGGDVARDEMGKQVIRLPGITYIFNDAPGPDGYLVYFSHFAIEIFVGATRVLASVLSSSDPKFSVVPPARRIFFPRCSTLPGWRDGPGLNAWFLHHALPGAVIEDANGWTDRSTSGLAYLFDTVVIVDRWSAHSVGGETGRWGKMNANVPSLPAPRYFWDAIRSNVVRSIGAHESTAVGKYNLPVIVFIDNSRESPRLNLASHDRLIEELKRFTDRAEVHVARMGSMSRRQQVEIASRAHVLISVHNAMLMSALYMRAEQGATVIEIFPTGGFNRDHQLLATSLGLKHIAMQPEAVLPEATWQAQGRGEWTESEIELDTAMFARTLDDVLASIPWTKP